MDIVRFSAGRTGSWRLSSMTVICGDGLPGFSALARNNVAADEVWTLDGVPSNQRYTTKAEAVQLRAVSDPLGRRTSTQAALIPIRKTAEWWGLAQDERREIFEEQSRHTTVGLAYVPRIARQLLHCRERGGPFDFLTWFEFAEGDMAAFDEMVGRMRASAEWTFVEREVDIRLHRAA